MSETESTKPTKRIPYKADCSECGHTIQIRLPFRSDHTYTTGEYVRCADCDWINWVPKDTTNDA